MRNYGVPNMVIEKSVVKLVNRIPIVFVSMEMCIRMAIPKWCLKKISALNYFSKDLR